MDPGTTKNEEEKVKFKETWSDTHGFLQKSWKGENFTFIAAVESTSVLAKAETMISGNIIPKHQK